MVDVPWVRLCLWSCVVPNFPILPPRETYMYIHICIYIYINVGVEKNTVSILVCSSKVMKLLLHGGHSLKAKLMFHIIVTYNMKSATWWIWFVVCAFAQELVLSMPFVCHLFLFVLRQVLLVVSYPLWHFVQGQIC